MWLLRKSDVVRIPLLKTERPEQTRGQPWRAGLYQLGSPLGPTPIPGRTRDPHWEVIILGLRGGLGVAVRYLSVCSGNLCGAFKREKVAFELRAERLGIQVKKLVVEGGRGSTRIH